MTELLVNMDELRIWLRGNAPTDDDEEGQAYLEIVAKAASVVVLAAGSADWTIATVPPRAQLIATLLAKNAYENPEGVIAESVGPISERKIEDVVKGMTLSDEEQAVLAELAGKEAPGIASGAGRLWVLGGTDDPISVPDTIFVPAGEGSDWLFPMYDTSDPVLQNWP